jgi:hypothetical protein
VTFPDRVRRAAAIVAGGLGALLLAAGPAQAAVVSATPDPTPSFNGNVWATAYGGNTLYVGGDFTKVTSGGRTVTRNHLAAVNASTGALLDWAPSVDGQVHAITTSGSAVYIGGAFTTVAGQSRDAIARLDAGTGRVGSFRHSMTGMPYSLAVAGSRLYAGGNFTVVDGATRGRLAAFDLSTGALDSGWKASADSTVETVVPSGSRIYLGGKFHAINGAANTRKIAAVTSGGAIDTSFKTSSDVVVHSIAVGKSGVYAATGGQGGTLLAYATDGKIRWSLTMDGDPQAVAVLGGTVYIGGHYDNVCRSTRTGDMGVCLDGNIKRVKLAAASEAGGALLSWTANGNGVEGVLTMASSGSRFAAGGSFTQINGAPRGRLAQFG